MLALLIAVSNNDHGFAGPPDGGPEIQLVPTAYTVGIIVCLALLLLWYGVVRPHR